MRLRSTFLAVAMLIPALVAKADSVITYNNAPIGPSTGTYTESGYKNTVISGSVYYENQQVEGGDRTNGGALAITAVDGSLFNLKSFDLILYNATGQTLNEALLVDGYLNGALLQSSVYNIQYSGSGYSPSVLEQGGVLANGAFSEIVFDLRANNSPAWDLDIDNVRLSAVTPEPSSLTMLSTGVLGLIIAARRRFAA